MIQKLPKNINKDIIEKDYNGNKLIHNILYQKNKKLLKQYIDKKFNLNLLDSNNNTPYHLLLTNIYDLNTFKLLINENVCWNNKNNNNISILDLILTNNNIFKSLEKYHHFFMTKNILENNFNNFNNICRFLDQKYILKYSDIIDFKGDLSNPPLFELFKNNNIKSLPKTLQNIIKIQPDIIDIKDTFGDNFLGKYIIHFKDSIDKNNKLDYITKFIDLGFTPNYQNPIIGTQPFKYLLIYSKNKEFLLDYYQNYKIDPNIIDNYGNNLGLFTIFLYNKFNWKTDKLFHTIIEQSDKNHTNLANQSINNILNPQFKGLSNNNNIKLINTEISHSNHFRARLDDIIFYFMVLDKKYNNLHIPKFNNSISSQQIDFDSNFISLPTELPLTLDMLPFFITFLNKNTYYINPYLNLIIKGLATKNKNDYAIVFLSLHDEENNLHANILFYNFNDKTITRFEPYGNTFVIDENIDEILSEELTWNLDFKYIKPSDYVNGSGLQSLSDDNNIIYQKPGDFGGFCLAWCLWFVEMKLKNKNISNRDLVSKSIKKIIKKQSLVDYIRSYGNKISDEKYKIYKIINLPQEIWSNINFNDEHNDIMFQEILRYINI